MFEKYDLKKMLKEIKEDELAEGFQKRKLTQDEIKKLLIEKHRGENKEDDKK